MCKCMLKLRMQHLSAGFFLIFGSLLATTATAGEVGTKQASAIVSVMGASRDALKSFPLSAVSTEGDYRRFIREAIFKDPDVYQVLVPSLIEIIDDPLNGEFYRLFAPYMVNEKKTKSGQLLYYLDDPCKKRDRIEVRPWWNLKSKVLICKGDYLPELERDPNTGRYCESPTILLQDGRKIGCGCGKNLVNCIKDPEQAHRLYVGMRGEVVDTARAVIEAGRPFSQMFTGRSTIRSDLADFYYERALFFANGRWRSDAPLEHKNDKPRLKERSPEFGGGILSSPMIVGYAAGFRMTVARLWETTLCVPFKSSKVEIEAMFHGDDPNIRGRTMFHLAKMEGCQNCHARLENAVAAYDAFTTMTVGQRINKRAKVPTVGFYVTDHNDRRGEGPATLEWMGKTWVAQPEFSACMVKKVEEFVYSGLPVPAQVHDRILTRFQNDHNIAAAFEEALIARFVSGASKARSSGKKVSP